MDNEQQEPTITSLKGVSYDKRKQKYKVRITIDYQCFHLGYFTELREALKARISAEEKVKALAF